jgi:4,5-dihydroxyphthalate decarboxylase
MSDITLSIAISRYDHVADLLDGRVRADGLRFRALHLPVEEIFFRMGNFLEFDLAEFSMGKYVAKLAAGDASLVAVPVFPSRVFRHSAVYVRRDAGLREPRDLAGRRVGVPEWGQTATVYTRGWLQHDCEVDLTTIDWVQAGTDDPGRQETAHVAPPPGIRITPVRDRSLSTLILAGEIDALISAREPRPWRAGHPDVVRLVPDARTAEQAYYRRTGIFPIMHVLVMRRDRFERHPWLAANLLTAFTEAKDRSLRRLASVAHPPVALAWCHEYARESRDLMGEDWWPYGIEPNRVTLEAFLQYCHEQGVTRRRVTIDELFPPQVRERYRA